MMGYLNSPQEKCRISEQMRRDDSQATKTAPNKDKLIGTVKEHRWLYLCSLNFRKAFSGKFASDQCSQPPPGRLRRDVRRQAALLKDAKLNIQSLEQQKVRKSELKHLKQIVEDLEDEKVKMIKSRKLVEFDLEEAKSWNESLEKKLKVLEEKNKNLLKENSDLSDQDS